MQATTWNTRRTLWRTFRYVAAACFVLVMALVPLARTSASSLPGDSLYPTKRIIEDIRLALEKENIESRPLWKPMHLQPVFKDCRGRGGSVSERIFRDGLCLPSGTALTDVELERVSGIIRATCRGQIV